MKKLLFLLFLPVLLIPVYAQEYSDNTPTQTNETIFINIPLGASDPDTPYFWYEQTTGVTTGEITILLGNSVTWINDDSAFHTITSVTQSGEEDGIFDSRFFSTDESYTRQFTDEGDFNYYCTLHPWMTGIVIVIPEFDPIEIPINSTSTAPTSTEVVPINDIPSWVKGVFSFWVNGQISDDELISAIKFLVNSGIIVLE